MRRFTLAVVLAAGAIGATAVAATDAASVIVERKANMKKIGGAFKLIMAQAKAGTLDAAGAAAAADLNTLSSKVHKWFPDGSGPDVDTKTRAKSAIWANRRDFSAKAKAFAAAARELQTAVAKHGDVAAAAGEVGGTCKACHDSYREAH
ncbi:MAG: cytochrome c [Sphingomicrobium sp.]